MLLIFPVLNNGIFPPRNRTLAKIYRLSFKKFAALYVYCASHVDASVIAIHNSSITRRPACHGSFCYYFMFEHLYPFEINPLSWMLFYELSVVVITTNGSSLLMAVQAITWNIRLLDGMSQNCILAVLQLFTRFLLSKIDSLTDNWCLFNELLV